MNIVDQQTFRDAMSCMGAAVNIITTDGPAAVSYTHLTLPTTSRV